MGTVSYAAYNSTILMAFLLALSRFDMLYNLMSVHTNKTLYMVLVIAVYCFGAFELALHTLPGNSIITDMTKLDFQMSPTHILILQIETICKLCIVGLYALLYGACAFCFTKEFRYNYFT
uniref:Uncharacterized protein n=1 Tax=Ditylenchus dipsaci TaxID=166011 RepID=A0A915DK54_9BILA